MEWILAHLVEIGLGIMVADKIVAATPCRWDDMILTAIKGALKTIIPGKTKF